MQNNRFYFLSLRAFSLIYIEQKLIQSVLAIYLKNVLLPQKSFLFVVSNKLYNEIHVTQKYKN